MTLKPGNRWYFPNVFFCVGSMCEACKHVCFSELCKVYGGCCQCVRNHVRNYVRTFEGEVYLLTLNTGDKAPWQFGNLMTIVLVASPELQGFGTGAQEHSMWTIPDYSKESKRHKWGHMNVGDLINCFLGLCTLPTISIFFIFFCNATPTRHSYNIAIMPTPETLKGSIKMAVILRRSR